MSIRSSSMVIGLTFLVLASFLFVNISINARGTDVVSDITSDTTWTLAGSPYLVKQSVSIISGSTLTVQAGVVIEFTGYFSLSVLGTIIVGGTPADKVIFTYDSPTPSPGSWEGIRFLADSNDSGSSITSASIFYATTGLFLDQSSPVMDNVEISSSLRKGISLYHSSPLIKNSKILHGLGTGIKSVMGSPTVQDTEVSGNANGVELINSNAHLQRNLIKSNGIGMLLNSSSPSIIDNDITLNQEGIEADYGSHPSLEGNTFSFNSKTGLWLLDGSHATLQGDSFEGNGVALEIEDSQVSIERISVSNGRVSLQAEEGSYAEVWNSSLLASEENALYLEQASTVVLTNTNFDASSLHIESGCTLYVRNFLTVAVSDFADAPLEDATVTFENDGTVVTSLLTGPSGSTKSTVVLYRTYNGGVIANNYLTTVVVKYPGKDFERNHREVEMGSSHTEFFHEMSTAPSEGGLQSLLYLIPLVVSVALLILGYLWIRKRKREEPEGKSKSRPKRGKKRRRRSK